jgi:hypothetical protein
MHYCPFKIRHVRVPPPWRTCGLGRVPVLWPWLTNPSSLIFFLYPEYGYLPPRETPLHLTLPLGKTKVEGLSNVPVVSSLPWPTGCPAGEQTPASNVVASESPAFSPSLVSRPKTYCYILWAFSSLLKNEDCLLSTFLKVCTYKKEMDSKIKQVENFTFECLPKQGVHRMISWGFRGFALPRMVIESSETIVHDLHHSSFSLRLR